jgi:hypothetical protein
MEKIAALSDRLIVMSELSSQFCRKYSIPERVNKNQGAESTLTFLMAQAEMRLLGEVNGPRPSPDLIRASSNIDEVTAHVL